jgi:hypothetical protein
MALKGWNRLLTDAAWCRGEGNFPIRAYSEFMPPPWLGIKPYGDPAPAVRDPADNWGWNVSEYEQAHELDGGLAVVAREILKEVVNLGQGKPTPQIGKANLAGNPYWPPRLAERAGKLAHEKYVILAAVALSKTQDDKGRVRWTLFGGSEQGPGKGFWKSFWTEPRKEADPAAGIAFFRNLLTEVYGVTVRGDDLAAAGLRILPVGRDDRFPFWEEEPLPSWCAPLVWNERGSLRRFHYLLTFRPFDRLPEAIQRAYLKGELHLLPFPGSLVFWGAPHYRKLQQEQPFALQIPLLHLFPRYNEPHGMQIPQVGWLDVKNHDTAETADGHHRPRYVRTHRFQRVTREEDETVALHGADHVTHVLFSAAPDDLGLYGKPMARNAQVWTQEYQLLLDGPFQGQQQIGAAARLVEEGGRFGYRFFFPPMRVGPWELYWHRPVAAYPRPSPEEPTLLPGAPTGYLTAYPAGRPDLERPVELWPRLQRRPLVREAVELFLHMRHPRWYSETLNVRALMEFREYLGLDVLPPALARRIVLAPKEQTLEQWLFSLPERADDLQRGRRLALELAKWLASDIDPAKLDPRPEPLTLAATATRQFETLYWNTIAALAHGKYRTKDNADCFLDEPTREALRKRIPRGPLKRDLDALGDYLLRCHERAIEKSGMKGKAWAGEHAFRWQTDFAFSHWGGWVRNQNGEGYERNIVVRIPGRDRRQAIIMADHYDTAYMADCYEKSLGGTGARLAANGADDNHSATAALLLAAPLFLELSKAGRLKRDIWLVHLTGEEFPSDCMGARALCQALVERSLRVREPGGKEHDLAGVDVRGVYVADMIAHNHDRDPYVFQIAPGEGAGSAWLALQAHQANELWNALAEEGNRRPPRRDCGRSERSADPKRIPALARYARLIGELRTEWDPRSTLYNTDGQIFSDAGVPVVLLMENYDINRTGYHDTHDTMENIDLDYGAALAAIFIETVARAATEELPG